MRHASPSQPHTRFAARDVLQNPNATRGVLRTNQVEGERRRLDPAARPPCSIEQLRRRPASEACLQRRKVSGGLPTLWVRQRSVVVGLLPCERDGNECTEVVWKGWIAQRFVYLTIHPVHMEGAGHDWAFYLQHEPCCKPPNHNMARVAKHSSCKSPSAT